MVSKALVALAVITLAAICTGYPLEELELELEPSYEQEVRYFVDRNTVNEGFINHSPRAIRSPGGWEATHDIGNNGQGTEGRVGVRHQGDNHHVEADWGKVLSGGKPTWHVKGTYNW